MYIKDKYILLLLLFNTKHKVILTFKLYNIFLNYKIIFLFKNKIIFKKLDGFGPIHYGVCSNYLREISDGEPLYVFVRR